MSIHIYIYTCVGVHIYTHVSILGGSRYLVTTNNWPYDPTHSLPKWPYMGLPSYK